MVVLRETVIGGGASRAGGAGAWLLNHVPFTLLFFFTYCVLGAAAVLLLARALLPSRDTRRW